MPLPHAVRPQSFGDTCQVAWDMPPAYWFGAGDPVKTNLDLKLLGSRWANTVGHHTKESARLREAGGPISNEGQAGLAGQINPAVITSDWKCRLCPYDLRQCDHRGRDA